MRKTIAVIGLGRFGIGLVKSLSTKNVDIIAVDKDQNNLAKVADFVSHTMVCDCTNEDALKEAGISHADLAIVALGQNDPQTIVTTIVTSIVLKNLGIKKITVRLDDPYYASTLNRLGVTSIISPFDLASEKLASMVASNNLMDYYNVAGGYNLFELAIEKDITPISLLELNSPKRFGVNIILIKRDNKSIMPKSTDQIMPDDHIFIFGLSKGVFALDEFLHSYKKQ